MRKNDKSSGDVGAIVGRFRRPGAGYMERRKITNTRGDS